MQLCKYEQFEQLFRGNRRVLLGDMQNTICIFNPLVEIKYDET